MRDWHACFDCNRTLKNLEGVFETKVVLRDIGIMYIRSAPVFIQSEKEYLRVFEKHISHQGLLDQKHVLAALH